MLRIKMLIFFTFVDRSLMEEFTQVLLNSPNLYSFNDSKLFIYIVFTYLIASVDETFRETK